MKTVRNNWISKKQDADFLIARFLDFSENFDILHFWKDTTVFPKLKEVARYILAIPAADTTAERNFSSAGLTLTPRRTLLSRESLSELLFIHTVRDVYGPFHCCAHYTTPDISENIRDTRKFCSTLLLEIPLGEILWNIKNL